MTDTQEQQRMKQAMKHQAVKLAKEWSEMAGSPIEVRISLNEVLAFGSELACLRLFHKHCGKGDVKHIASKNEWYYLPDARTQDWLRSARNMNATVMYKRVLGTPQGQAE